MTAQMKNKVKIDDFLTLIYWIKTFQLMDGKRFDHQNLLDQAETYKLKNTPLDTQIHHIDDLMIDAFQIYHKLKETEEHVQEMMDHIQFPFLNKEMMINETKKYQKIFEDLIENYKYDDPEIRGIQMDILQEKMKNSISVENYEESAKIRDLIKELNY